MLPVDLWIAEPPSQNDPVLLAQYERWLSEDEHATLTALCFERNRHEQLVARALVRASLSRYAPTLPEEWRFVRGTGGRPEIDPPTSLRFNLSHHPTMVVCAVTRGAELGVDVEPLSRGGEILALADRIFTGEECRDLRTLAPGLARERAVSLWTLKEAYAKARGLGLSLAFDGFGFSFDEPGRPRIAFGPGLEDDPERWAFALHDASGHRIAVAVERLRGDPELRVHFGVPLG